MYYQDKMGGGGGGWVYLTSEMLFFSTHEFLHFYPSDPLPIPPGWD